MNGDADAQFARRPLKSSSVISRVANCGQREATAMAMSPSSDESCVLPHAAEIGVVGG